MLVIGKYLIELRLLRSSDQSVVRIPTTTTTRKPFPLEFEVNVLEVN